MRLAVVTPFHGRHEHLRRQQESMAAATRAPDLRVLVAMDDAVPDLPSSPGQREVVHEPVTPLGLPLAAARNHGVRRALDLGADAVVLLDVDVLAGPGLLAAYADALALRPDVLWSGPVTYLDPPPPGGYDLAALPALDSPHPARPAPAPGELVLGGVPDLFWSLSFAVSAETWRTHGGFCEEYVGYGGEDTDLGHTLVARGVELGWVGAARGYHQHHAVQDPPVGHLDDILRNAAVFHRRWGRWPMGGWLEAFEGRGLVRRTPQGWVRVPGSAVQQP